MAISPQLPRYSKQIAKKHDLGFEILSDEGNAYARQLGLVFKLPRDLREVYEKFNLDLPRFNGDDSWELPLPARFIVTPDHVIQWAEANVDYRDRPEPEATIAELRRIAGPA